MTRLLSSERIYYIKFLIISIAIGTLLLKSEQDFSHPLVIIELLCSGFYLGRLTCSLHIKQTSIWITLLIFILMNIIHSFIDGIGFIKQTFFYWITVIVGHEIIRQPTLYIILWAILSPINIRIYLKLSICFFAVTGAWFFGIWIGRICGSSFSQVITVNAWIRYGIFLFIGDIAHHMKDQYSRQNAKWRE